MIGLFRKIQKKFLGDLKIAVHNGMKCGKGVSVAGKCHFGTEPYLIELGNYVRISFDVVFITHDGGTWVFRREKKYQNIVSFGKIVIGDNTFIGARTVIMPGVSVGSNCVIGAGSIVTKDIPNNSVACGNPARVIRTLDEYINKKVTSMPKKWDAVSYNKNKKAYLIEMYNED